MASDGNVLFAAGSEVDAVGLLLAEHIKGRVLLVTGANGGLGRRLAATAARHGAKVVVVCRAQAGADGVAADLRAAQADADVVPMAADLGSLASVRAFAQAFLATGLPLHALVHNAGVMACPRALTANGLESQLGVNHVAAHLLTQLLWERLVASGTAAAPAHVVTLSSYGQYAFAPATGIFWDDLSGERDYDEWSRYGQSKLANILFVRELQRRADAAGSHVIAAAVHPGVIRSTGLERHRTRASQLRMFSYYRAWWLPFQICNEGRGTATQLACAFDPKTRRGGYYYDGHVEVNEIHPVANDAGAATRLWAVTEDLIAKATQA
jgi:retinol dehydrogenase 12